MDTQLELNQKPFIELQIETLIEENQVNPNDVNEFVDALEQKILEINKLNYDKLLNRAFRIPLIGRPNSISHDYPKGFKFIPPEKIELIGGFRTNTVIQKTNYIDLAVSIPSKCFEKKDIKNQRYHHKRALYLTQLAHLLDGSLAGDLIEKLEFRYHQGDFLKPVLLITPKYKFDNTIIFQLFAYPESENAMKTTLLKPSHGNISPKWFFKDYTFSSIDEKIKDFVDKDSDATYSAFYNSGILFDMEIVSNSDLLYEQIGQHSSIRNALMLTKIWLFQRELHQHFSFIISMFIAYLQTKQTVHQNMNSYQIFKVIMKYIAESFWDDQGLSYFEDSSDKILEFKAHFKVVFLSPSGNLNMCYNITQDLYDRLKHEAKLSQKMLNSNTQETFELLFLKRLKFMNKFDVLVHLPKCTKKLPMKLEYLTKFMDHGIFTPRVYSDIILDLVKRSLTDRVTLIQQSSDHLLLNKKWKFRSRPYDPSNEDNVFTVGLLLEPENSLRVIDIGPEAQTPEADNFIKFWEPKCQLRLQNGIISETVVWHVDSFSQRRAIIKYILAHALRHANVKNLVVHYTLLERFINLNNIYFKWRNETYDQVQQNGKGQKRKYGDDISFGRPLGVGEEVYQKILHGYNELNRIVRNVQNLKHTISSIQPTSHHLRSSSVFPPLPVSLQKRNESLKRRKGVSLLPENFTEYGKILHIEPIEILITLDSTGKWPNEFEALEAAKLEYLIQLAEALKEKDYTIKFSNNYLDVLYGQFVYRLKIKVPKELNLVATSCGKQEYQKRRLNLEILPRLHSSLDQLYREKTSYGLTCRIVKRWICCHLMTEHLSDLTIDLIVANLYLHPEPYTEPSSSLSGFARFLRLLSEYDWKTLPLVVNFDNQIRIDEINRLKDSMNDDRSKYPPMVICTPYDKEASPWTKSEPTEDKLKLLSQICSKAFEFFNKDILSNFEISEECNALFRPNFKLFNILIKLQSNMVQNSFMRIDMPNNFKLVGKESSDSIKTASALKVMPIIDLNVVEQFVKVLREHYDGIAYFFYDKYGQRVIGVMLKTETKKHFQDSDMAKFILGIKKLGSKLVESVKIVKHDSKK